MKPKEIIAEIMDRIPCVERPGHNMLAHEIVKKLEAGGYVIVQKEPTPAMVAAGYRALNACPDKESDIMEPIYEAMLSGANQ